MQMSPLALMSARLQMASRGLSRIEKPDRPALGPCRAFDQWPSPRCLAENAAPARSVPAQVAFLDNPLVRLAHALDAVLNLAAVVRKRADDFELAIGRCTQRAAGEAHGLAGAKLMTHVYLNLWQLESLKTCCTTQSVPVARSRHRPKWRCASRHSGSLGEHARQTFGRNE